MDKQEIFNTVATHLFTQGKPSIVEGRCKYRAPDGCRCAAGCLIPDSISDEDIADIEGKRAEVMIRRLNLDHLVPYNGFINKLQDVHDGDESQSNMPQLMIRDETWRTTDNMRAALRAVAKQYAIDDNILDTLKFADR